MRHSATGLAVLAGALIGTAAQTCAQTAAEVEKAAIDVLTRLDLQTQLPVAPDTPLNSWWDFNLPYLDFSTSLLWIVLVVALVLVLYALRHDLPVLGLRRSADWRNEGNGLEGALGGTAEDASTRADDLAGQGHFVEAMHLLLLKAFAEIRDKLGVRFSDSLTSREILRRTRLPDEGKASLKDIIMRVELSYFGTHPAGPPDYAACRTSFDRLMALLGNSPKLSRAGS